MGGRASRNIRRGIDTALNRAGLKITGDGAHLLRHTAAVRMAESGVPMAEISRYLGHSNTTITERTYARFHLSIRRAPLPRSTCRLFT